MALAIVQHKSAILGLAVPGVITLASAPTPGNLIVVFLHCNITTSSLTINASGWPHSTSATASISTYGVALFRYVQPGDTTALPALCTAGSTFSAYEVYEVSGVVGTYATDVQAVSAAANASNPTSLSPTAIVTLGPNALAFLAGGHYNGGADPTLSSGWTTDEVGHNASNYGSQISGNQAVPTTGTSVSGTVTFGTFSGPGDAFIVVISAGGAPVNANITQASAAGAAGTVAPAHSGSGGISQASAAAVAHALIAGPTPRLQGVAANAIAGDLVHLNGNIKGVQSYAIANAVSFYATPIAYFPGVRIMRDTPVPGVGEMDNDLVAGIGRMYVCGPQPVSREFFLVGVATIGAAAGIQSRVLPTNELTGAAASCFAGTLTTTSV